MPHEEPQIVTVKQLANMYDWLNEKSIRWMIYRADENGLAPCLIRLGRRVFIDKRAFWEWFMSHKGLPPLPRNW